LFDKFGYERTKELMDALASGGKYELTPEELEVLREDFDASFSSDEECETVIGEYAKKGYIMDPHTATCIRAYKTLRKQNLPTVVYSTAEWTKFSPTVSRALGHEVKNDLDALDWVKDNIHLKVPQMVTELFNKPLVHDSVIDKNTIKENIFSIL
jgi:threonine synthase